MTKEPELVDIDTLHKLGETARAFKVTEAPDQPDRFMWLPKSLVEENGDGTFTMPQWLARERGLI